MCTKKSISQITCTYSVQVYCKQRRNANKSGVFFIFLQQSVKAGKKKSRGKENQDAAALPKQSQSIRKHLTLHLPTNKTKCYIFHSLPFVNKRRRMATQTSQKQLVSPLSSGLTSATFEEKKKCWWKIKMKITQTHRELCVADDPSGNKLVLGGGAALGGRVRVRLVADDHFGRDAQPLFDNAAADEDKCKMKCWKAACVTTNDKFCFCFFFP